MNAMIRIGLLTLLAVSFSLSVQPVGAQTQDASFDSAVFLLRQSMKASRDNTQSLMLRALRQIADPQMEPLFNELATSAYPTYKIHGMLGLAESSKERQIDLVRLAAVEDPAVQAELVSAALDSKLLTLDQCQQLVDWPGLDVAVKVLVSAPLVQAGRLSKIEPLQTAAKADNPTRKGLANLLLLQLGQNQANDELDKLITLDSTTRDQTLMILLSTAVRYELDRAGPWALKVAMVPNIHSQLGLLALSVALRFNTPGSASIWQQQFATTTDISQRTRLALLALRVSPWSNAGFYDALIQDKDPLMSQIGKAGAAVASGKEIAPAVINLIELRHPISNAWALSYASKDSTVEDARMILLALVLAYEQGPVRGREQRLDDASTAVMILADRSPDDAIKLLQPILTQPNVRRELAQGILMGLLRSQSTRAYEVIQGVPIFEDINTRSLALLLMARSDQPLTTSQMDDLALCVRGGGLSQDSLRIQAAWNWLKRTNQVRSAIDKVLGS